MLHLGEGGMSTCLNILRPVPKLTPLSRSLVLDALVRVGEVLGQVEEDLHVLALIRVCVHEVRKQSDELVKICGYGR